MVAFLFVYPYNGFCQKEGDPVNDKKVASFRERVVELVDSCPKSQTQISQEFGVAKQTISAWYNGKSSPKLPTATSLADYFNVSLGWLLGFDVEKQVNKHALDEYENYLISSLNKQENLGLLLPEE